TADAALEIPEEWVQKNLEDTAMGTTSTLEDKIMAGASGFTSGLFTSAATNMFSSVKSKALQQRLNNQVIDVVKNYWDPFIKTDMEVNGGTFEQAAERLGVGERAFNSENLEKTLAMTYRKAYLDARKDNDVKKAEEFVREFESARNAKVNGQPDDEPFQSGRLTPAQRKEYLGKRKSLEDLSIRRAAIELEPKKSYATPEMEQNRQRSLDNLDKKIAKLQSDLETLDQIGGTPRSVESLKEESGLRKEENDFTVNQRAAEVEAAKRRERHKKFYPEMTDEQIDLILANNKKVGDLQNELLRLDQTGEWSFGTATREEVKSMINRLQFETDGIYALNKKDPDAPLAVDTSPEGYAALNQEGAHELRNDSESPLLKADGADPLQGYDSRDGITLDELLAYPVAMGAVDWRKISVPPSVRAQVGKILLSHLKSYDQSILNNSVPAGVLETMYGQAFDILAEGSPKSFLQSGVSYGTQRKAFIERHKRSGLAKQTLLELHSKSQDNVSLGRTKRINDLQLEIDSMVNPADIARAMDEINELKQLNEDVKRSNIEDSTALEEYEQKQLQDEFDKQNEYKEGDLLDSRNQKPIKNAWEAHQDSEAELALARGETAPQKRTLMDYFMLSEKELSDLYRQYVGTGASRTIEDSNINKTPSDLMRAFKSFHERMSAQGMSDAEMTAIMENAVGRVTETLGEKLLANPDLTAEERKHRGTQEIEDLERMVEKRRRISEFEVDALSLELGLSTSDIMTAIIYAEKHQGSPGQTMRLWLKSHPGILATPDPVTPIGNALLKTSFYRDRSDSIRTELMDVRSSVHTMVEDLSSMDKTSLEYLSKLREWHEAFEHLNELSAKMNSYDRSYIYGNYDLMKSIKEANGRDAGEFFLSEAGDVRGDVTRALMEKIPKRLVKDIRNAIAEGNGKTPGDQNKADLFVEAWENRQALKNERYPGVSEEILDRFNETVSSLRDKEGNPLPQYVGAEILFDMYHAYLDAGRGADPTDFRDGIPRGFLLELERKYNEREQSARDGWTKQKGEVLSVYHDLDLSKVDSDGAALLEHYSFNDTDGSVELDPVSMGHVRERLSERIRDFREMNQNFEDWFSRRSEIMADPIVKDIPDIGEVISSTTENLLINWNRLSAKQKAEASVKLLSWDRMGDTNLQVKTDAAKIVLRTLDSFQQELETGKTPLEIVMNMYQDVYAKLEGDLRFRGDRDITTGMLEEKRIERGDLFTKQQLENTEILSRLRGQPFMSDMPLLTNAQIDTVLGFAHEGADTPVMESGEAVAGALKEMAPDPFFGEKASKSMGAVGQGLGFVPTTQRHPMSKQQAAESTGVMGQILSWVYDRKASRPHAFNNVWEPMYQWISGRETHLEKSVSSIKDKIDADKTGAVTEKSVASLLMHPTTTDISALYRGGLEAVKTEVETVRTVIGEIIAMRKAQGLKETFKGPGDFLRAIQRDSRVDARKNPNYIPDINKVQQFAVDALLKKDVKSIAEGVQLAHDIINGHVYGGVNIKMLPSHVKTLLEYIPDPSAQLYSGVRKFVRSTAREISENYLLNETAIASDVRRNPKDVQLVSTQETKYYSLEGKWVDPEVAKAMNQDKKAVNQLFKGVQLLNSIFKQGKIIYSTTSYVNNFFGNFALLQMGGVPLHYSITAYPQAAKDVIRWITTGEMTTEIKEAIDAGLFQGTMTKNMLAFSKSDLDTLTAATGFDGVNKILFKCVTGLESNRMGATGRTVYEGIEQIHRFIGYQYYRTHGANASTQDSSQGHGVATPLANLIFRNKIKLDPAAAAREVDQALFDYRDLPRGVKMLRDSFIPFVSFPFLAGRSYLRNSYHNPRGVASMVLTGVLLREGIRLLTGRELELEGWIPYWSTVDPLQRGNTRYGETFAGPV
ncbi:MAG: hypothetical protein M0P69_16105, partial [Bacteroidales bacterium]|nr:hypothetical protein [Bacteroidales bacterium]